MCVCGFVCANDDLILQSLARLACCLLGLRQHCGFCVCMCVCVCVFVVLFTPMMTESCDQLLRPCAGTLTLSEAFVDRSCFFGHCHLVMVLLELHRHCVDCSETFGTIYKLGGRGEAVVARREHVRIRPLSERQEGKRKV